MNDILALPTGPLVDASLALVQKSESTPIADHSIRSFLFARLVAEQEGCLNDAAYDENLLFAACVMHDLGLGTLAAGQARFEVEGADLAASVLTEHGIAAADVDRVWEAIALHSSLGIADRRGLLTYLTHKGVFTDAGHFTDLDAAVLQPIYATYPRPADDRFVQDAIVEHAARSQAAAPPYSIAAELLRQRQAGE
ncbi:HD domain-containing protein [Streptomyces sp. KM273126]|uniref:HD domain-containing protein n=1 Tax=Streptomyces sp. KM273126 TaxID=2545247 RepID=UPI0010409CF9|nr:HD domain-containing protein [Streptomyces sp. KM273126]MBA2811353.1 HD domain-containing protein [Streptomyces sp. KM273126]